MRRFAPLLVVVIFTLAALPACGGDDEETSGFDVVLGDVERAEANPSEAAGAAGAGAQLGFDILQHVGDVDANAAISPYSIQVALAMTRNGARGQTRGEMDRVLHAENVANYDGSLNALDQLLLGRAGDYLVGGETVTLELSTANALWGQQGVSFEDSFLNDLARWYGAGMRLVDYAGATEEARDAINEWVAGQTRDRIPELIPQGAVSPSTVLVLTNAVYLNAPWAFPFDEDDTMDGPFHRLDGSTVDVPLMHQVMGLQFSRSPGYAAVELPYAGQGLAMLLVVPDEGQFEATAAAMDATSLRRIVDDMTIHLVTLDMPRFEFRTQALLNDILAGLGMPTAFGPGADFSGMTGQAALSISAVLHEAFIAVDEIGTEAAAATAVILDESAPGATAELRIDRPFFFFIRDTESGALLFMGRVTDPSGS